MIDVAGVAALVIWLTLNTDWVASNPRGRRRVFLHELSLSLVEEHIANRVQNPRTLQPSVKFALKMLGKLNEEHQPPAVLGEPARKRCKICPRSIDRKTSNICSRCNRNVCGNHSERVTSVVCGDCAAE